MKTEPDAAIQRQVCNALLEWRRRETERQRIADANIIGGMIMAAMCLSSECGLAPNFAAALRDLADDIERLDAARRGPAGSA